MVHAIRITRHGTDVFLDKPKSGLFRDLDALAFSGWAVPSVTEVQIEFPTHRVAVSKTLMRPDVTAHLGRIGVETSDDCHGFAVLTEAQPFQVYALFQDGTRKLQLAGEVEAPDNVMLGANGWLFLSSSNGILEQAAGTFNPAPGLKVWDDYLERFDMLAQEMQIQWRFCIAPSKELIVPELAPFPVSDSNFLAVFLRKSRFREFMSCPMESFKNFRSITYWPCDTHWTEIGAAFAVKDILESFNISHDLDPTKGVDFKITIGDLSEKMLDQHSAATATLSYEKNYRLLFDNYAGIGGNTGRFMIWESNEQRASGTLFVSGGSSFLLMFKFIAPWFKKVVFLHGTGRVDVELLADISPTHVLLQNNSRFMPSHFDNGDFSSLANMLNPAQMNENWQSGYSYYDRIAAEVLGHSS
ncbi:hypothetical protein [Paracoccus marcusii]|uniref:hypothetical protein n=1 Tax=Paracoccus marcusii TaxID=59779 RepID=UPI003266A309